LTWDHVFPEAWYPETTPMNLEKWKVPSCGPCNAKHGKSENDLFVRLGLCIDPDDPKSAGIVDKALRALNAEAGRDEKDAQSRLAMKRKILGQVFTGAQIPLSAVYPGFGPNATMPHADQVAVPIKKQSVDLLTEKIVRGITYLERNILIEEPYKIDIFALHEDSATPLKETLARFGGIYERGPGILVERAVVPEDQLSAVYRIDIWGRFKSYAVVSDSRRDPAI
jgi:hypothetical protein